LQTDNLDRTFWLRGLMVKVRKHFENSSPEIARPVELTVTGVGFRLEDANDSEFKSQRSRFSFGLNFRFLFATNQQSRLLLFLFSIERLDTSLALGKITTTSFIVSWPKRSA
jgi:hypothetical protein